jgi:hypothetical protein
LGLPFKPPARLDAIEIAVEVDLQKRRRMIGGPTGHLRHNTRKAQPPQIQLIDEDVNRPHRIVFSHVVVKELGEQNALPAVLTLDEALPQEPRLNSSGF